MNRPVYADPTLWRHEGATRDGHGRFEAWSVAIVSGYSPNPVAHRVVALDNRLDWQLRCGTPVPSWRTRKVSDYFIDPRHAAQFALPCLRCWPDANEGREATVAARAKATP